MKLLTTNISYIIAFIMFSSCHRHFTKFPYFGTCRDIPSQINLPPVYLPADTISNIISVSTVDRYVGGEGGYRWIPRAPVVDKFGDRTFKLIVKYIDSLSARKKYLVQYSGSNKNDSLYKSIMTVNFKNTYNHLMMQAVDFSTMQKDGLYLIVTYILNDSEGFGGGGASRGGGAFSRSNTLYELFEVKNGKAMGYSGISLGRGDKRRPSKRITPTYAHLKLVFKKLYKKSAKLRKKELEKE